jgi:hypothetical protein
MKTTHQVHARGCYLAADNGSSVTVDLSPVITRHPDSIVTPPNSSSMCAVLLNSNADERNPARGKLAVLRRERIGSTST